MHPLPLFYSAKVVYSPSVCLYETNFPNEGGHFITHLIFKTCEEKSLRFDFNHKHIVEAKMLIKLVVVDSNDLIRYKCKIAHCLDFQTLSEYISTIALDNNEKLSMNEVLEVLICVGAFTSTSSFDT